MFTVSVKKKIGRKIYMKNSTSVIKIRYFLHFVTKDDSPKK